VSCAGVWRGVSACIRVLERPWRRRKEEEVCGHALALNLRPAMIVNLRYGGTIRPFFSPMTYSRLRKSFHTSSENYLSSFCYNYSVL